MKALHECRRFTEFMTRNYLSSRGRQQDSKELLISYLKLFHVLNFLPESRIQGTFQKCSKNIEIFGYLANIFRIAPKSQI